MTKLTRYLAAGAISAMLLPGLALAHGNDDKDKHDNDEGDKVRVQAFANFDKRFEGRFRTIDLDNLLKAKGDVRVGTVTSVGANSFTVTTGNGAVFTVNTTGSTTFNLPFQGSASFSSIHVNDMVKVRGTISGSTITAGAVVILPANTLPAKAKGAVTAVSGNTLTLQTNGGNTVTVNTNANTAVTKADGSAGTTADVGVGAMVKIKGLWNTVLNVLTAINIKLF